MYYFDTHIEDGIVIYDLQDQVVFCNPAFQKILGYSDDEIWNTPVSDLFYYRKESLETLDVSQLIDDKIDAFSMEKEFFRRDGSKGVGVFSCTAVREENGDLMYTILTLQDITKQKEEKE